MILGITGPMASGKGTLAQYLKEKYNASTYRFSTPLRDALDRFYIDHTRENITDLSEYLRGRYGQNLFAKTLIEDIKRDQNKIIIVEGIRRIGDLEPLQTFENFVLVKITAPIEKRYEYISGRNENTDDQGKSLEEFKKEHELPTEQTIAEVLEKADEHIINDGSLEDLHKKIDDLVKKYR